MTIRRGFVPDVDRFTPIPNDWLRDERLSFKARGLLAYLLSHREGWEISGVRDLVRRTSEGRQAVAAALNELEELGYIERDQGRRAAGKFGSVDYLVGNPTAERVEKARSRRSAPVDGKPVTGNPLTGKSNTKKNISKKTNEEDQKISSSEAAAPRPDVDSLCALLADLVVENGSPRPTITKAWRDAARLMLDKDGRDADKAANLIRWCQADGFWRSNVMSMVKFRTQYDQLRLKASQDWERQRQASAPRQTNVERAEQIAQAGWEVQAAIDAQRASLAAAATARMAVSA